MLTDRQRGLEEEYAKAEAAADTTGRDYQKRAEDLADQSSPDVEGFPAAALVAIVSDADRFARQLDELATQLLDTQRTEERLAKEVEDAFR